MIKCCVCGKEHNEIFYTVSLSEDLQEYRLCVRCSDYLKGLNTELDNIDYEKYILAKDYFTTYLELVDPTVKFCINSLLNYNDSEKEDETRNKVVLREKFKNNPKLLHDYFMLTTGFDFEGYIITKYYDVLSEEMIIGMGFKNILKSIGDSFSIWSGAEFSTMNERLTEVKNMLRERVLLKAFEMGANALIGIDFERSITGDVLMVSMSATAVTVQNIDR